MIIHLPIVENRIAQFAARFERQPVGGIVWFKNDWSGGLPVSEAEMNDLIARHAAILHRAQRAMRWWLPIAVVLIIALVVATGGEVSNWWGGALFVLPLPWVFYQWWRAHRLPVTLTQGRRPIAPARGLIEGAGARLAALPLMIPLAMIVIGTLLLVQLWRAVHLASEPLSTGIGFGVIVFGLGILGIRVSRR